MTFKTYNRISAIQYPVGHLFEGSGAAPLIGRFEKVEVILERRRPAAKPARAESVYMREGRDFKTVGVTFDNGYVHELVPNSEVERRDLYWIGVLQSRYFPDERFRSDREPTRSDDDVADLYWSGEPSENQDWEWVTKSARVIAVDDKSSSVRPGPSVLNLFI